MQISPRLLGSLALVVLFIGLAPPIAARERSPFPTDILVETFGYGPGTPSNIDYDEIYQGCPVRDCIPALTAPEYLAAGDADFMQAGDLVLGVEINGDARAYPELIMNFHEIVNDTIGGVPVAVTFCPLCGSGVAFERRVAGEVVELGVSGLLHGSDLVMYDRKTDSLWQQITGEAVIGPRRGEVLKTVPLAMVDWKSWRAAHPKTRVLSRDTGHVRDYSRGPYGNYAASDQVMFPVQKRDLKLHPKTVVHGFTIGGQPFAVLDSALAGDEPIAAEFGGRQLTIRRTAGGGVIAGDPAGGESWHGMRLFWFAWYNFHPDTARLPE